MKKKQKFLRSFLLELGLYSALVTVYFFLVLHFLGSWLKDLFDSNKFYYAVAALVLIIGQGVMLETMTTWLLGFVRSKTE